MPDLNPLTSDDLADINQSLANIEDVLTLIKRTKMAGIDTTENEKRANETKERLKKLKNAFFPNQ